MFKHLKKKLSTPDPHEAMLKDPDMGPSVRFLLVFTKGSLLNLRPMVYTLAFAALVRSPLYAAHHHWLAFEFCLAAVPITFGILESVSSLTAKHRIARRDLSTIYSGRRSNDPTVYEVVKRWRWRADALEHAGNKDLANEMRRQMFKAIKDLNRYSEAVYAVRGEGEKATELRSVRRAQRDACYDTIVHVASTTERLLGEVYEHAASRELKRLSRAMVTA